MSSVTMPLTMRASLGAEVEQAVALVADEPQAALAAGYEVLLVLLRFGQWLLLAAHVDEHLVAVHPVVEQAEVFYDLVLGFVDSHDSVGFCENEL